MSPTPPADRQLVKQVGDLNIYLDPTTGRFEAYLPDRRAPVQRRTLRDLERALEERSAPVAALHVAGGWGSAAVGSYSRVELVSYDRRTQRWRDPQGQLLDKYGGMYVYAPALEAEAAEIREAQAALKTRWEALWKRARRVRPTQDGKPDTGEADQPAPPAEAAP